MLLNTNIIIGNGIVRRCRYISYSTISIKTNKSSSRSSLSYIYTQFSYFSLTYSNGNSKSWIDNEMVPKAIRPYLHLSRADKQVGTLLLLWPCLWSTALAAPHSTIPDMYIMTKFAIGSIIMRSAGCVINDLWDKDFDKHVERTKSRPLASGELSTTQAIAFLGLQLSCGLGVLLSFNTPTIILGIMSMPLVVAYPLMKRVTNWPQFVLGCTFNWGALVGWTAVTGEFSAMNVLPLYAAGVSWTLVYDTIYGYQDRKDDKRIGVKSTSLHLGDRPQLALTMISSVMLGGLVMTGVNNDLGLPYYFGASAMWSHVLWQIWTADLDNSKNLWARFNSNKYAGAILTAAIIAGHF